MIKRPAHMTPNITISLITLNHRGDLERLLPSLVSAAALVEAEIMLVDNGSYDGSSDFVRDAYPEIVIMENRARSGYGENHNLNLASARGQYFVIMNSDMTVERELFVKLKDLLDSAPRVGIVTPKILNPDGSIQGLNKRFPTVWDLFLRRFMPKRILALFKRRLDYYEMRDVGYDRLCDVPFISGAFMFCRTDVLKAVGGFDPRYFLYFEDVDLCRRVQRTHQTIYYPGVSVTHFWQREAHRKWNFMYYFIASASRYFLRWGIKWW